MQDDTRFRPEGRTNQWGALFTVEPFGVVLGSAQWRHVPQAPVDDRVTSGEVYHRRSIQLPPLCYHGGGIVAWVVGTTGNTVHSVQYMTGVTDLTKFKTVKGIENIHKSFASYHAENNK